MTAPDDHQDALARALADALRAADEVPERFWEVGLDALSWLTVDAELAELVSADEHLLAQARQESPAPALLTFTTPSVSVRVEVTEASLEGQVVPPAAGSLEVRERTGRRRSVHVDEDGWFRARPAPQGPFQLCYRAAGRTVLTEWARA